MKGLHMSGRTYGHIDGVHVGEMFPDRVLLSKAGIHRAPQSGITGGADGADVHRPAHRARGDSCIH